MTTTLDQRQRLAAMGNVLRPDWPAGSLLTLITQDLKHRSYRDIAVALAFVATDLDSKTPGRLREPGPWWEAARPVATTTPAGRGRCERCQSFHGTAPCDVRNLPAHQRRNGAAMARAELAARRVPAAQPTPEEDA